MIFPAPVSTIQSSPVVMGPVPETWPPFLQAPRIIRTPTAVNSVLLMSLDVLVFNDLLTKIRKILEEKPDLREALHRVFRSCAFLRKIKHKKDAFLRIIEVKKDAFPNKGSALIRHLAVF
jgi:hypothetical protein